MAQFITTAFSSGNDIALQMGQEEWVRKLAIGSDWNTIRIGLLFQITGTANTPNQTGLAVGMCSGTTNPFGNASTTNFVGMEVTSPFQYNANAPNPYWVYGNSYPCKKLVATITQGSEMADSVGGFFATAAGNARRGLLFVNIVKGSPNYTIGMMFPIPATPYSTDFLMADLLYGLIQPFGTFTSPSGGSFHPGNGAQTLACSEAAGGFDTVDIYCNLLANPFNLYAVGVEKLA